MSILHRYLLLELARNAVTFLSVIVAIFFVMSLALMLGRSSTEALPIEIVAGATAFQVVSNLGLIGPLTVLSAAIFTYGRAHAEGEFTAVRVAGIHPWQAIVPAAFVGSLVSFGLIWVQDEAVPDAHFQSRLELRQNVFQHLDSILAGQGREISQRRWNARWKEAVADTEGHMTLLDLLIIRKDKQGRMKSRLLARRAWPIFNEQENRLRLVLESVRTYETDGPAESASRLRIDLDLDELSSGALAARRQSEQSYEQLLTKAAWYRHLAALADGDQERCRLLSKACSSLTRFHGRVASAFSALFFALLGASLGLFRPVRNRALVFLVGFLLVVGFYYPLQQWGRHLALSGAVVPGLALWIGNAAVLILSLGFYWKAMRG